MASATPDLRLPSQSQSITAIWPVPNYTAWWERHMGVFGLLSSLVARALGSRSIGRWFNSRPVHCRAATLGNHVRGHLSWQKLFLRTISNKSRKWRTAASCQNAQIACMKFNQFFGIIPGLPSTEIPFLDPEGQWRQSNLIFLGGGG